MIQNIQNIQNTQNTQNILRLLWLLTSFLDHPAEQQAGDGRGRVFGGVQHELRIGGGGKRDRGRGGGHRERDDDARERGREVLRDRDIDEWVPTVTTTTEDAADIRTLLYPDTRYNTVLDPSRRTRGI